MNQTTQKRYDSFCMAYHQNGNNATLAAKTAGYSAKTARQQGQRLLSNVYIKEKLKELQNEAVKKFDLSLDARYEMLNTIFEAGLESYMDAQGNQRRENLAASLGSVKELNLMLGTTSEEDKAPPLNISFNVTPAVGDVQITEGA